MRVGTLIAGLFFSLCALTAIVVVGRYGGSIQVEESAEATDFSPPPIASSGPHPQVVVDEVEHEFGVMEVGSQAAHTFVVRNEGEAPLKLKKGKTTCKCTISELANDEILPGESVEIQLEWEPREVTESFRQTAVILTNDPEQPELELVIRGSVQSLVILNPPDQWNVGDISEDSPTEVSGHLYSKLLDEFDILNVVSENPLLTGTAVPLTEEELEELGAKSGYSIQATLEPGVPVGPFREKLVIETDVRDKTNFTLYVSGKRPGPIEILPLANTTWYAEPMAMDLGRFPASRGKSGSLAMFIRVPEGVDFEFTDIHVEPDALQVSLEPDERFANRQRRRYILTVEYPPGSPSLTRIRQSSARIILKTNHPEAEELKLYVQLIAF